MKAIRAIHMVWWSKNRHIEFVCILFLTVAGRFVRPVGVTKPAVYSKDSRPSASQEKRLGRY